MGKEKRFEKIYTQGTVSAMEIWVDKETGVHYLFCQSGYGGGLKLTGVEPVSVLTG